MHFGRLEKHVFCTEMGKTWKSQSTQPAFLLSFFTNQLSYPKSKVFNGKCANKIKSGWKTSSTKKGEKRAASNNPNRSLSIFFPSVLQFPSIQLSIPQLGH